MDNFQSLLKLILKAKKGQKIKNMPGLSLQQVGTNKKGKPIMRWVRNEKPQKKERPKAEEPIPKPKKPKKNEQQELNFKEKPEKPKKEKEKATPKEKPEKSQTPQPPKKPRVDPFKESAFYNAHKDKLDKLKNIMGQGRSDDIKKEMQHFIKMAKENGSSLDNKKGFDSYIQYWENQEKWNKLFAAEERGEQVKFFGDFPDISKDLIKEAVKNGKKKKRGRKGKGGSGWDLEMMRLLYRQYGKTWFDKISEGTPLDHGRDRLDSYIEPQSGKQIKVSRSNLTQLAKHNYVPSILTDIKQVKANGGKYSPLNHQIDAANLAIQSFKKGNKSFLLADGTGGGKTISALSTAAAYLNSIDNQKPVVVVTESDLILKDAWIKDAKSLGLQSVVINGRLQSLNQPGKIVVTTYSQIAKLSKEEMKAKLGLVIFDEAHNLKSDDSETHKIAVDLMNTVPNTMLATATPIDNLSHLPYILHSQGIDTSLIDKELKIQGADATIKPDMSDRQKEKLKGKKIQAAMNIGALFNDLTKKGLMVKREVPMENLSFENMTIKPTAEQTKLMNQMLNDYKSDKRAFGGLMAIRRLYEQFKMDETLKEAKRIVDGGGKVLIFAESVNDGSNTSAPNSPFKDKYKYKGTLPEIGKRLKEMGIKAEGLFGGSPTEAIREQNKRKIEGFKNGDTKIMYGNADTMGTGVSFDDEKGDSPRTILMMTPPFSAMDFVQVLGRINRLMTKSPAKVKLIGMENSPMAMVDEWMNQILRDKVGYLGEAVKGDISEFDFGGGKTKKVTPKESGNYINIDNYRTNPKPIKLDFGDQSTKKSKNWEWFLDHLHKGIEKKVDRLYEESY